MAMFSFVGAEKYLKDIEEHQKDYVFDLIMTLDSRRIEASQKKLKAEYDKIKRKK